MRMRRVTRVSPRAQSGVIATLWSYAERVTEQAPLLRMVIKRTPKGYGGTTLYGNTYDLSAACPRCGTGATRTSWLILKKSDLPQGTGLIQTGHGETLASRDIADSLVAEIVSGLELREHVHGEAATDSSGSSSRAPTKCHR
jgi:hypothetical protein